MDTRILNLIATVIERCEPPPEPAPGHPPTQIVRVLATLRRFLREGSKQRRHQQHTAIAILDVGRVDNGLHQ